MENTLNIFFYGLYILFVISLIILFSLGFLSLLEVILYSSIVFVCTRCIVKNLL